MVTELPAATRALLVVGALAVAGAVLVIGGFSVLAAAWCRLEDRAIAERHRW